MVLTPEDIANKDFSRSVRGFNENEVNDFLDEINDNYARTLDENTALKNQLSAAQEKVKYFSGLQDALNKSILIAQQTADRVKKDAEKERDRIIYDAENDAKKIAKAAAEKANQIQDEALGQTKELAKKGQIIEQGLNQFHQQLIETFKQQLEYANDDNWLNLLQSHFSETFEGLNHYKGSEIYDDVTKSLLSENPDMNLDVDPTIDSNQQAEVHNSFDQQAAQYKQDYEQNGYANFGGDVPNSDQTVNQNIPSVDYEGAQVNSLGNTNPANDFSAQDPINNSQQDQGYNLNSQSYADPYNVNPTNPDLSAPGSYYPQQQGPALTANQPFPEQGSNLAQNNGDNFGQFQNHGN